MPARNRFVLACVAFACVCGQARPADEKGIKPTSQIRLRSLDGLREDLKFLGNLADQGTFVGGVEQQLEHWLPKGFEGVDSKKAIFAYAGTDPANNEPFGVLLVPVSNEAAFVQVISKFIACRSMMAIPTWRRSSLAITRCIFAYRNAALLLAI